MVDYGIVVKFVLILQLVSLMMTLKRRGVGYSDEKDEKDENKNQW